MEPRPRRLLTISQAAARLGIHPDTLRGWADRGVVAMVRTPTGYRRFSPQEIERIRADMDRKGSPMNGPGLLEETDVSAAEHLAHKRREARIRRALAKDGYLLRKSRTRHWTPDDQGEYMVIELHHNIPVAGSRFDSTLDDVEAWMEDGE